MYDYPLASSSSSTPPSPVRKHLHRRSQSPLPHLATLLPSGNHHHHHHHHHHRQYSPSTRAADISRLLDPAYASSSSSSSMSPTTPSPHAQTRAYVDHNGDLHDPDYRDFPVLRPTSRPTTSRKQRRTSTGSANAARSRSHDRYSANLNPTRPAWERDWTAEGDDSDAEDIDDDTESQSHFSPFASQHASARKNTSHSAFNFSPYQPPSYYYFTDAPQTSSPVGSLEEEHPNALGLHESPFGDDEVEEVVEDVRPRSSCLIRKSSKPKKDATKDEKSEVPSQTLSVFDESEVDEHATTPTCTHILRQQWEVLSLRIRFGLFHAKRRLRRRRT